MENTVGKFAIQNVIISTLSEFHFIEILVDDEKHSTQMPHTNLPPMP